jgi:hypothetical protein
MAPPCMRELALYDGQECIGTIEVADDGEALAFDQRGKPLGSFQSVKAASVAISSRVERSFNDPGRL